MGSSGTQHQHGEWSPYQRCFSDRWNSTNSDVFFQGIRISRLVYPHVLHTRSSPAARWWNWRQNWGTMSMQNFNPNPFLASNQVSSHSLSPLCRLKISNFCFVVAIYFIIHWHSMGSEMHRKLWLITENCDFIICRNRGCLLFLNLLSYQAWTLPSDARFAACLFSKPIGILADFTFKSNLSSNDFIDNKWCLLLLWLLLCV